MTVRQQQVARQLMAEVSDILRNRMRDPRLGFVTLVDCETSRDLRHARIYVSVLAEDPEERKAVVAVLQGAAGYMRTLLAKRLEMRCLPALAFRLDDTAGTAGRIEQILAEMAVRDDSTETGDS